MAIGDMWPQVGTHRLERSNFIHKQKTQTDGAKYRTFRSSLRAVKNTRLVLE